jgi:hypothetical protein
MLKSFYGSSMPTSSQIFMSKKPNPLLFIAILIVLVGGSALTFSWFTNEKFRNTLTGKKVVTIQNSTVSQAVEQLGKSTQLIKTDALIYDTINFRDLPVYPKAWVAKYFNAAEQANQLISSETADADSDGLSNKEEYFYASNPRKKDTFCDGKTDNANCKGKTDKDLVKEGISPLTGLELVTYETIRVKKQDFAILRNIQDSFEIAAKEGVDFPTLYQLSKSVDLRDEFAKIPVITQGNERENILNYINLRVNLLQDLIAQDQVSLFTEIYQSTKIDDIRKTQEKYNKKNEDLRTTPVPEKLADVHKSYIFFFDQIVDLLKFRADGIEKKTLETEESKKTNKEKAVRVVWAYRTLSENLNATQNINLDK